MCEECDKKSGLYIGRWEMSDIDTVGDRIVIRAHRGLLTCGAAYESVGEPNILDRLLGITLDDKVESARKRVQAFCDKENKAIEKGIQLCRKYKAST